MSTPITLIFSSDSTLGGITIRDTPIGYDLSSFIAMDEPWHSAQHKKVLPMFTPRKTSTS